MDEFKDNILDGVVYSFHFQGVPAVTAHEKLAEMTGGEVYTLDKVKDLYRRIDEKKFGLRKQDLSTLPEHILQNVIEYSGWRERAALRKTCKPLRHLVNVSPSRLKLLFIHLYDDTVSIEIDGHVAMYRGDPRRCSVSFDHGRQHHRIGNLYKMAMSDLSTILVNANLEVEDFYLKTNMRGLAPFFEGPMLEAFSLNHSLHIEHFSVIGFDWSTGFVRLLQSLKPEILQSISAHKIRYGSVPMGTMFETPQALHAKKFESIGCQFEGNDFTHLTRFEKSLLADVRSEISFEVVMDLKNRLLTNPGLDQLKIQCHFENDMELVEEFRQLKNDHDSRWAHFDYPGSQLKLSLRITSRYVWFKGPCYVEDGDDPDVRRRARRQRRDQRRIQ